MGGGSKKETTQTQSSQSEPWKPTIPYLETALGQAGGLLNSTGINSAENAALDGLTNVTQNGYNFAPQIAGLASDLFTGGADRSGYATDTYNAAYSPLSKVASQSTDPWSNADFTKTADLTGQRAVDAVKSAYTGAGIPAAAYGDFAKNVGAGVSNALAPMAWQARNDLTNQSTGAAKDLYSMGGSMSSLMSGLDQTALANRQAGVGVADAARTAQQQPYLDALNIEAKRRDIPVENLSSVLNMILPIAGLGQQAKGSGTSTTYSNASPLEQALQVSQIGKNVFSWQNPFG